jgi:hypothetical protein
MHYCIARKISVCSLMAQINNFTFFEIGLTGLMYTTLVQHSVTNNDLMGNK